MKSTIYKQLIAILTVIGMSVGSVSAAVVTSTEDMILGDGLDNGTTPSGLLESDNTQNISGFTPQAINDYYRLDVQLNGLVTLFGSSAAVASVPPSNEPLSLEIFTATSAGGNLWNIGTSFKSSFLAPLTVTLVAGTDYIVRVHSDDRPGGVVGGLVPANTPFTYNLNATSVVPVPAAVWLFGTAVLGLIGIRRKKRMLAA